MEIKCQDVSGWECGFTANAETADDIRQQMIDHFLAEHGEKMAELSDKQQNEISEKIEEMLIGS